ncbi:SoxR reducing system RseC family protein [Photobacterium carnosum]|jgi:sigma-E factor negative regulatory protein RseC|uniref:Transcriptional regulator n=1 Tax=Photobacterium carnosum TaxID=2023717 RepID=A0A2N4UNE0_9GAMM|nr:SoxR reducing system RseC family protein [Photobacterium carnosum]KAE8176207.1 transcriptional regulator [Photobacterium carnosum]MCD9495914.1 transcriptional regulator [Photobacterium carnosum]MCD9499999.1 transcriptional regulator [Photobacterium carnosum]MCD9516066.1 transcriptional regulator [Photobacterium carnosum]MCD9523425.1 transcriptional regulator [Photobacterium carnosum]
MMRTLATVVAVDTGHITVSCQQQTSCGHCASSDSCGTGIVTKAMPGRSHQINIDTKEKVLLGQVVEIGLSERSMLSSALLVYMLPLLFLVVGSLIGQYVFIDLAASNQLGVIVSAAVATTVGLMIARYYAKRLDGDSAYKPSLIRVLGLPISADKLINAASKDSD